LAVFSFITKFIPGKTQLFTYNITWVMGGLVSASFCVDYW